MDVQQRPTTTSIFSSNYYDHSQEKLIRHKLFMLSCEKLAELRHSNEGNALKRNLAILSVCKKARSADFYPVNECKNLLSVREANTRTGPLFTRRSTTPSPSSTTINTTTNSSSSSSNRRTISTMQVIAPIVPQAPESTEEDSYPTFMPSQKKFSSPISSSPCAMQQKAKSEKNNSSWFNGDNNNKDDNDNDDEEVIEYSIKDIRISSFMDFDTSDSEIEEGADALDVFFMDEDGGSSMARKRKSIRLDTLAGGAERKRHCDEEVKISPKSTSCPIPIPRPMKQPDQQVVLDTLVPMRGFFQFR